jgi:hypothetical protein
VLIDTTNKGSQLAILNGHSHNDQMGLDTLALLGRIGYRQFPSLLYPYCITTWAICQGVFEEFFKNFFGCCNWVGL